MASQNREIIYNLPSKIKETRKSKDMTQTDLGLAMGTNKAAISKLESGNRIPDLDTVAAAADALETPLSDWFGGSTESDPFLRQFCERAKNVSPEKRASFEAMINAALNFAEV